MTLNDSILVHEGHKIHSDWEVIITTEQGYHEDMSHRFAFALSFVEKWDLQYLKGVIVM